MKVVEKHELVRIGPDHVEITHIVSKRCQTLACGSLVLVTMRLPDDALYHELTRSPDVLDEAGIKSVVRIGDCLGPSTIAAAVYAGHRQAREIEMGAVKGVPFKRERSELEAW